MQTIKKNPDTKRMTRDSWLQLGLKALGSEGVSALTVERICQIAGKTRGSFYHHFFDHNEFVIALLDFWQENSTQSIIDVVNHISDPSQQRLALAKQVVTLSAACENAIRGWGGTDNRARDAVALVDQTRLEFLQRGIEKLATESGVNLSTTQAQNLAMVDYGLFIGVLAVKPDASADYFMEINALSEQMLTAWMRAHRNTENPL